MLGIRGDKVERFFRILSAFFCVLAFGCVFGFFFAVGLTNNSLLYMGIGIAGQFGGFAAAWCCLYRE